KQTTPMERTGLCETISPTDTPTSTPTETATATATSTAATSTATPFGTPPSLNVFLPIISKALPTPTPTVPPAVFDGCQSDPNPASAPNYPIKIVKVDKVAEVVTLQNVSNATVSLEDWNMCSINGNQEHDQIFGTIAPGQIRDFPNTGGGPIWD